MSYSSEVLADSPLAYYRLGEASGTTAVDASGNGRDGTYTGSPAFGVSGIVGAYPDTAITLNSTDDYTRVTSAAWMAVADETSLSIWVKLTASGQVSIAGRSAAGSYLMFDYLTDNTLRWYVNATSGLVMNTATVNLRNGAWRHIVGTYHKTSGSVLYVDGAQVGTAAAAGTVSAAGDLRVGRRYDDTGTLTIFSADEFSFYPTALSPTRVARLYATGSGPNGTLSATLPTLSAGLSGGIEFSGTITAVLPPLGANLAGTSLPPGVAGTLSATLPPLGASLAGAYSDTATLTAILPPLSANLTGTVLPPPVTGTVSASLPALAANLVGQSFEPGTSGFLAAVLPALSASLAGDVLGRVGLGLVLDSSATVSADTPLEPLLTPTDAPATSQRIVATSVPAPTLVAGRPQ